MLTFKKGGGGQLPPWPPLPTPLDSNLSSPIHHYISESLICQVLGQLSFSLTSLLVSAVVDYMGVPVTFTKAVVFEDICKLVGTSKRKGGEKIKREK